jgi:hypothetical protein
MRLAPYLFQRLLDLGTAYTLGIHGDHVRRSSEFAIQGIE